VEYITQDGMKPPPAKSEKSRRAWAVSRKHFALHGTLADRVISVAHILGRPVRNAAGTRIGRVSDIVVRWDAGDEHPPVTRVFVKVRGVVAAVQQAGVTLSQTEIRLRPDARMEWRPVWGDDDVALARDVLDRQLVDTSGVQVVRAADAYLLNGPQGWELAGIDVGLLSLAEGSLPAQGLPAAGSGHRLGSVAGVRAAIHGHDHGLGVRTDDRGRYRRESSAVRRTAAR
jgi:sporulation protein YlmC with PRC-barrel domain